MIDLHVHTDLSDGFTKPSDTIIKAKAMGISHLVFTDHNCVFNNHDLISKYAQKTGVVIPFLGVELNSIFTSRAGVKYKIHVLIYGEGLNQSSLVKKSTNYNEMQNKWLLSHSKIALESNDKNDFGIGNCLLVDEEIGISYEKSLLYRTEIAQSISERTGKSVDDIKQMYLPKMPSEEKYKCAIPLEEIITNAIIEKYIVIVAHPGWIRRLDNIETTDDERECFFNEIFESGIDGCEVYHRLHSEEIQSLLEKKCMEKNLIITGGSDFHGKERCRIGEYSTPETQLNNIIERIRAFD